MNIGLKRTNNLIEHNSPLCGACWWNPPRSLLRSGRQSTFWNKDTEAVHSRPVCKDPEFHRDVLVTLSNHLESDFCRKRARLDVTDVDAGFLCRTTGDADAHPLGAHQTEENLLLLDFFTSNGRQACDAAFLLLQTERKVRLTVAEVLKHLRKKVNPSLTPDSDTNWSTNCHLRSSSDELETLIWSNENTGDLCMSLPVSSNSSSLVILPFHWDHPHVCTDREKQNKWRQLMTPLLLNNIHPSCSSVIQLLLESEFVFDVRRTLSDTIFLVLMRLMTSSWMQEEMEYPLMRTISSPTYTSAQDGTWMTPSLLIYIKITDDFIAAPTTYIPNCWTHQLQYEILIYVTDLYFDWSQPSLR